MSASNVELLVCLEGKPVRKYGAHGRTFVEGRAGTAFTLKLRNSDSCRYKAIVAVDGLNVISGEPSKGDRKEPGYIVPALGSLDIDGWRTSDNDVARFVFARKEKSYAAGLGHGSDGCGVIGAVIVREKETVQTTGAMQSILNQTVPYYVPVPYWPVNPHWPVNPYWIGDCYPVTCSVTAAAGSCGLSQTASVRSESSAAGQAHYSVGISSAGLAAASFNMSQSNTSENGAFALGTAYGEKQSSPVQRAQFEEGAICDTLVLHYASAAGLTALGIDLKKAPSVTFPPAFNGYCKPPKTQPKESPGQKTRAKQKRAIRQQSHKTQSGGEMW